MKKTKTVGIAFVQRLLPIYRLGFYKALSKLNYPYHFTLFCPKGSDTVTNIKTISPEVLNASTNNKFDWIDTKITFYNTSDILWQSGLIIPVVLKRYDVLMLSNKLSHLFYWLLILICKLRGIKIIFWSHGLQGNETGFKFRLKKWYLNLPDVNLVYADYNKDLMVHSGSNPQTIQIVYNSLDFSEQDKYYNEVLKENKSELKRKLLNNNHPVIIFLGRLEREKQIDMLLKAVSILRKRGLITNVLLAGAGKGPELEMLKSLTINLGLNDYTHFLGRLEEPELVKYFYFSDVSVSPGNVGLNCIHSLNYGVPVITHNDLKYQLPEVEVLVENETGVFFRHNDVDDLANKIEYWLTNHSKNEISEKLRKIVKHKYSPEVQAQCVLDGISLLYRN